MRISTLFLAAVIICPLPIFAGRPHIIVNGDPPNPTVVVNNNFTFGTDNFGGGDFTFQNESGSNWQSLLFTATLSADTPIVCGPGPFVTCTVTATQQSTNDYLYSILMGPTQNGGGVANGQIFSIDLNDEGTDPGGSGSWGADTGFKAAANVTPEPSTIALALLGLAGFAGWRKFHRKSFARG